MKTFVPSVAIAALSVFAILGPAPESFAEIVYKVTNYAEGQNGWTINGTISVSGIGTFTGAELTTGIMAWDITASKDLETFRTSSSLNDASSGHYGSFTATASQLLLNPSSSLELVSDINTIYWQTPGFLGSISIPGQYEALEGVAWLTSNFSPSVGDTWTLGVAVPEIDPASSSSALSLVAAVLAIIEQRRRRAMIVA